MTRHGTALGALLVGALAAGCGGAASGSPDGRLVLLSGRDDHGLVATQTVALHRAPESRSVTGRVADGTLARVVAEDGQWLRVQTAEGPAATGWVDDFYLRGVVHLVGPTPDCRAELSGHEVEAGLQVVVRDVRGGQVLVTSAADPSLRGWAGRSDVQELGPQGSDCGEDPPGSVHTH